MRKQYLLYFAAVPMCVNAAQSGTGLVVRGLDGKETHISVERRLEISADSGNLVFTGADGALAFEIPEVHGFYYVNDFTSVGDIGLAPVAFTINDSSIRIFAGSEDGSNVRIFADSGMVIKDVYFTGETEISFSGFHPGIYIAIVNGRESIKIYVR